MNKNLERAKEIISQNKFMTISTASLGGRPWVSPVFFVPDDKYNLYWVSNKEAKHSKLIAKNPQVAIVIFDSSVSDGSYGVYFEAEAAEISEEADIKNAIKVYSSRPQKDEFMIKSMRDVVGGAVWRIYRALPKKTYVLGDGQYINGQYVDVRTEVKF